MHVDGFRFDLASALARELHEVDRLGAFFDLLRQDPVLNQVKLIAEPWDLGAGATRSATSRRVGRVERQVPRYDARVLERRRWTDWRVRAPLHRFERPLRPQRPATLREHQLRRGARRVHLEDLVSYNEKHNDANLEANRDGHNHNLSWNCGAEDRLPIRRCGRCASGRSAICLRPFSCRRASDAARRRRDGPHPAWQQQRLLPGQRGLVLNWTCAAMSAASVRSSSS